MLKLRSKITLEIFCMKTDIFKIENVALESSALEKCASLINSGNVIAFPTETVYGLGANIFDNKAVRNVFKIKQR